MSLLQKGLKALWIEQIEMANSLDNILNQKNDNDDSWISVSDMMTGLMMIFLFIAIQIRCLVVKVAYLLFFDSISFQVYCCCLLKHLSYLHIQVAR